MAIFCTWKCVYCAESSNTLSHTLAHTGTHWQIWFGYSCHINKIQLCKNPFLFYVAVLCCQYCYSWILSQKWQWRWHCLSWFKVTMAAAVTLSVRVPPWRNTSASLLWWQISGWFWGSTKTEWKSTPIPGLFPEIDQTFWFILIMQYNELPDISSPHRTIEQCYTVPLIIWFIALTCICLQEFLGGKGS